MKVVAVERICKDGRETVEALLKAIFSEIMKSN